MRFCDHHGWRWDPGQGPSPCVGETMSFWLAFGFLGTATIWATNSSSRAGSSYNYSSNTLLQPYQFDTATRAGVRQSSVWESARRIHRAQVALSLLQAAIALVNGLLCARPEGMLCAALVLHTLGWTSAWVVSASELRRNPRLSKALLWWWLAGAISNSFVLSSLHHESGPGDRGMPPEVAALLWIAFLANALLVVLHLSKPDSSELDEAAGVYLFNSANQEGAPTSSGWQAFWAGDEPLDFSSGGTGGAGADSSRGYCYCWLGFLVQSLAYWCCCCWCCIGRRKADEQEHRNEHGFEDGAWSTGGEAEPYGSLNDSLLGNIGLRSSSDRNGSLYPLGKSERNGGRRRGGGFFHRTGKFLSSLVGRGNSKTAEGSERSLWRQSSDPVYRPGAVSTALSVGMGTAILPRVNRARSRSSSAYSIASAARAPPQASAPVFDVSVTRWRLVDADGIPTSQHGLPMETWTDRSTDRSSERSFNVSFRTATTLTESDAAATARGGIGSSSSSPEMPHNVLHNPSAVVDVQGESFSATPSPSPLRVQFELAVRSSGRGELDWWGRGAEILGGNGAAAGDWRVWRSAADVLALYDALALRFGQEFCGRVARPQLRTAKMSQVAGGVTDGEEVFSSLIVSPTQKRPNFPHRVDSSRDARAIGAFLRTLMGLRQFLSTAVMDFLAQPPQEPPAVDATLDGKVNDNDSVNADSRSWDGSDDSGSDRSDDDSFVATGASVGAASHSGYSAYQRPYVPARSTGNDKAGGGDDSKAAGEAVAGAALAADYGAWLKRLAVKLRRSTPAGERFVRLRRMGPAVTGEQVVRWLVASSGECRGDRASAVRVGQDMVSRGLLAPMCAGYGSSSEKLDTDDSEDRDLLRSFDDGVGWLFAYAGDALRDPFAPPPATRVSVMAGSDLDVRITHWIETSDEHGAHVQFVVRTQVEETHEAWEVPRRYRDFTQLRKRLLRLGIDLPTAVATSAGKDVRNGGGPALTFGPDLPKKTWRSDKFDKGHLTSRQSALEAYLQGAVKAALAAPHLAGNLVMRFLDPDESNLRVLAGGNPFAFASGPRVSRGNGEQEYRGDEGRDDGITSSSAAMKEEKAEEEDFDTLTESLGGFG